MTPWAIQDALVKARYGLAACQNLELTFVGTGDLESVKYFQARQRHYSREIAKLEAMR